MRRGRERENENDFFALTMLGWKLIPDRAGFEEVPLTQCGQRVTIGRLDCDITIPNERKRVSRTHAVVKVCPPP